MGDSRFDASTGLAFSLVLFEKYRKNGLLHAELHHVPHIPGYCRGYLQLVEGKVTSCYVEEENGQRHLVSKQTLIDVDEKRGPFDWSLQPLPAPPSPTLFTSILSGKTEEKQPPTPQRIALLELDQLTGWSNTQRRLLATVYAAIDGRRTLEEIKQIVPLPPHITDEVMRTLLALSVIRIIQKR
jgi:hypothetical protein